MVGLRRRDRTLNIAGRIRALIVGLGRGIRESGDRCHYERRQ
jgi:hypothetical protein